MQTIFVAEDEENIRELISYALKNSGYNVVTFADGEKVVSEAAKVKPDLVMLDIMMPVADGITVINELKSKVKTKDIPVIMLTAKSTELDKVKGLDMGADDYITKPFSVMELISRIKAVLRRTGQVVEEEVITFGEIEIDKMKRQVFVCGEEKELTYKEFELLSLLIKYREKVLSRDQIINDVWSYDFVGESRTVDMHIKSLRQKLGDCGKYICTIRNVGYVMRIEK